jgi:hypothetical protein
MQAWSYAIKCKMVALIKIPRCHVFLLLSGLGTMRNKRLLFSDRRHGMIMPRVPFKDSRGATIRNCRRKIFDRRIHNIQAEWIEQIVIR